MYQMISWCICMKANLVLILVLVKTSNCSYWLYPRVACLKLLDLFSVACVCAVVSYCFSVLTLLLSLADVPSEVDSYHSLFPLEPLPPPNRMQKTSNFSYITSCYKAVNSKDDLPYCLRRIHGKKCGVEKMSLKDA